MNSTQLQESDIGIYPLLCLQIRKKNTDYEIRENMSRFRFFTFENVYQNLLFCTFPKDSLYRESNESKLQNSILYRSQKVLICQRVNLRFEMTFPENNGANKISFIQNGRRIFHFLIKTKLFSSNNLGLNFYEVQNYKVIISNNFQDNA